MCRSCLDRRGRRDQRSRSCEKLRRRRDCRRRLGVIVSFHRLGGLGPLEGWAVDWERERPLPWQEHSRELYSFKISPLISKLTVHEKHTEEKASSAKEGCDKAIAAHVRGTGSG